MTQQKSQCVGLVGVGIMGTAIATRLLECGHQLTVFDRNDHKVRAVVHQGAIAAENPQGVADSSQYIILSLNNADAVQSVVFGSNGIQSSARPDKVLIDMSSIDPEATKQLAARLKEESAMPWLDCPLSGGAPGALSGNLTVMAGGDAGVFERSRVVMDDLCGNYTLMGPQGAGQTTKLVNQVLCAVNFQAIAEATQLALNGGVEVDRIPEALAGGRADSRLLQEFMAKMGQHDYTPTGRLDNMLKDLLAVQAFAAKSGTAMPVTSLTTEIHRLFVAAGKGGEDNAALMKLFNGPAD